MNKVTIALLLLISMQMHGAKPKKLHRLSWKQYRQEIANMGIINNHASIAQQARCRAQELGQQKITEQKITQAGTAGTKPLDSDVKVLCANLILAGCLYVYVEHGHQVSNYFNTTKLH